MCQIANIAFALQKFLLPNLWFKFAFNQQWKLALYLINSNSSKNRKRRILFDTTRIRTRDSVIMVRELHQFQQNLFPIVICITIRFEVCANSSLQTHEISADYSVGYSALRKTLVPSSKVTYMLNLCTNAYSVPML